MEDFFNLTGSLICHQLASRSLHAGSAVLPVCARDMGIYSGIFVAALFIASFRRMKAQKPPDVASAAIMCALMAPMVADGILSYTGIFATNNTIRLFTGLLFGIPIPVFLVPAANFNIGGPNEKPVLRSAAELAPVYAAGLILCLMLIKELVPYHIAGLIFVSGFAFLLSRLSYTIFARMRRFSGKTLYITTLFGTMAMFLILYLISAFILQPLKEILLAA